MSKESWWIKRILAASSIAELREAVTLIVQQFGFPYFIYRGRHPHLCAADGEIRMESCPAAWSEYASISRLDINSDPIHRRAAQEATPVMWREQLGRYPEFLAKAREFGLVTGVTHPTYGPDGALSTMSFIKGVGGAEAEREIFGTLGECQLVTCYVHKAVARIAKPELSTASSVTADGAEQGLTERERECLTQTAAGKTAAEIGTALALSERTVIYHLTKARRKLNAINSRHAVSKAVFLKLISTL